MDYGKTLKKGAAAQFEKIWKAVSIQYFLIVTLVSQVVVIWLSAKGSFFPGADAMMQIVGTCAEIIAGLYGITLFSGIVLMYMPAPSMEEHVFWYRLFCNDSGKCIKPDS